MPSHDALYSQTEECVNVLEKELLSPYRTGSLLDFTSQPQLPLIVVPDLHARCYFIKDILECTLPADFCSRENGKSLTVREALKNGAVRVVCVGDALHSEMRGRQRWMKAYLQTRLCIKAGDAMTSEMTEGLSLLMEVMKLKCEYPASFHFLKGNHENIRNRLGGGDYPFCKFTDEGAMTNEFMRQVFGEDVIYIIGCFEDALPLAATVNNCAISHAEPKNAFTREEIINARLDDNRVEALTWTANDEAEEGAVAAVMKALGCQSGVYITGHRPVSAQYNLRAGGLLVQIHNPEKEQIALVRTGRKFNPKTDILELKPMNGACAGDASQGGTR